MAKRVRLLEDYYTYQVGALGRDPGTAKRHRRYVSDWLRYLADRRRTLDCADLHDVAAYLGQLRIRYSAATVAQAISVCRAFMDWCVDQRLCAANPFQRVRRPPVTYHHYRAIPEEQMERVVATCLSDVRGLKGLRDRAVFLTLYSTAMRNHELCGLDVRDVDLGAGTVYIRRGKGGKPGTGILLPYAAEACRSYLLVAQEVWDMSDGPFFRGIRDGRRISGEAVRQAVRSMLRQAGIPPDGYSPHSLRASAATHLHHQGVGLDEIRRYLRHARVSTTSEVYLQPDPEHTRRVVVERHPLAHVRGGAER